MSRALVRADGSAKLGLGHMMRCIGLAESLRKAGIQSVFVTRNTEPAIADIISCHKFEVQPVPLSYSLEQDKNLLIQLIEKNNVELIITDLSTDGFLKAPDILLAYLRNVKKYTKVMLTIDDLNVMNFPSDIVLNPNYGAKASTYPGNNHTVYLLGPAYFIFRQEFIDAAMVSRKINEKATNILVSMGGSDLLDLTSKVLRSLKNIRGAQDLKLQIAPGIDISQGRKQLLDEAVDNFAGTYEFCNAESDMAALMLWADVAITGGGLTKYETAVTGTPSIIIPQIKHQAELSRLFAREGSAIYLGPGQEVSEADISLALEKLLHDSTVRAEMSKKGKKLVDGRGVERIIARISGLLIS